MHNDQIKNVIQWAHDRGLINPANVCKQTLKCVSEVGELADNIGKDRFEAAKDDIGDTLVTIIILCEQLGTSPNECLAVAWDQIKDRKGVTSNGIFIKSGDLPPGTVLVG